MEQITVFKKKEIKPKEKDIILYNGKKMFQKIVVHFDSIKNRDNFGDLLKRSITKKTKDIIFSKKLYLQKKEQDEN
jgi:hypothetical protein